ncbi:cupredoxin domain-containing protein [Paenibacillus sp. P96]|uniref:Cupredoxin domain-containing protein n=1 Tax=Paenibacillus zeirhizosphaerae TaxID=2987519 RepID=A0ABT9FU05_9BACL|nr:cupredoxin domain-containing protein [Paenibacillus sp. P96]MDP4098224.1 cupredoxin domain-containing protein [Paenibacillus sp. P96]
MMTKIITKWWPLLVLGLAVIVVITGLLFYLKNTSVLDKQQVTQKEDLANYEIVTIKVENDSFTPAHIEVKEGVPTKINFKKMTNLTHIRSIVSQDLDMFVYLENEDNYFTVDETLKLGTYNFNCGMYMTYGTITVK